MKSSNFKYPSEIAFEELKKRVEKDSALDEEVRAAFLDDLSSTTPDYFSVLKQALERKKQELSDDLLEESQG